MYEKEIWNYRKSKKIEIDSSFEAIDSTWLYY